MLQLHQFGQGGHAAVPGMVGCGLAGGGGGGGGGGDGGEGGAGPPAVRQMRVQEIVDELTMAGSNRP